MKGESALLWSCVITMCQHCVGAASSLQLGSVGGASQLRGRGVGAASLLQLQGVGCTSPLHGRGVGGESLLQEGGVSSGLSTAQELHHRCSFKAWETHSCSAWEGRGTGVRGVIAVSRLRERGVSTAWGASSLRGRASPLRGIGRLVLVS